MEQRTVSLALGSGGARGLAHIGVIESLEAHGFDIQAIAGTSMGALIGGFYAAGKLDIYARWVTALDRRDVIRLLDFAYDRKGLFKGERIINLLKEIIGDYNIEELPISFTAVATDLHTEKEVWLNRGPLFDAIRASISIPTIFTPFEYQGMQLLDGGLINPVPIAPTLAERTDLIVAVNLNGPPDPRFDRPEAHTASHGIRVSPYYHQQVAQFIKKLYRHRELHRHADVGFIDIAAKSMDIMQRSIARFRLAAYSPDLIIDIPSNACAFHEFHRAREMIELGRHRADQALSRINYEKTY